MKDKDDKPEKKDVRITIESSRGTKEFTFPKQTKIADVITTAVNAFGFATGDRYELVKKENLSEALQPERTLVSYQIGDGAVLVLTSIGGGV